MLVKTNLNISNAANAPEFRTLRLNIYRSVLSSLWAADRENQGSGTLEDRVGEVIVQAEKATAAALVAERSATASQAAAMENASNREGVDLAQLAWAVSDALRYTVVFPSEKYTDGVRTMISLFERGGLEPVR